MASLGQDKALIPAIWLSQPGRWGCPPLAPMAKLRAGRQMAVGLRDRGWTLFRGTRSGDNTQSLSFLLSLPHPTPPTPTDTHTPGTVCAEALCNSGPVSVGEGAPKSLQVQTFLVKALQPQAQTCMHTHACIEIHRHTYTEKQTCTFSQDTHTRSYAQACAHTHTHTTHSLAHRCLCPSRGTRLLRVDPSFQDPELILSPPGQLPPTLPSLP